MGFIHIFCTCLFIALFLKTAPVGAYPDAERLATESRSGVLGPLEGRNQAPVLNLLYVLPVTDAYTLGKGRFESRLHLDISNIHRRKWKPDSVLLYDMEIYRVAFHMTYGLLDKTDLHIEIPALAFNGGWLDGFIRNFHDFFGLGNGTRDFTPDNEFAYSYERGGETIFDFPSRPLSLSDVNLDIKWQIFGEKSRRPAIALRAGIKFPTGNYDEATGSGEFDYGLGVSLSRTLDRFHLFAGFDREFISTPEKLRELIDEDIYHFFLGTEFGIIKRKFSFVIQIDGQNTPFVPTGQATLDDEVLEIIFGFKGAHHNEKLLWQISLRENLITDSTVGFTFTVSLGARF